MPRSGEKPKVFIKNFGCSLNYAEGEVLAGCLHKAGYPLVDSEDHADILIFNTCAVKTPTENKVVNLLKNIPREKKLVVVGCLPLINYSRLKREVKFDAIAGPSVGSKIVEIIESVQKGEKITEFRCDLKPPLDLPRLSKNRVISIIPIAYGCLSNCNYCCVKHARGRLRSYHPEEIVRRVEDDLRKGAKEIWLTAQDTACYGLDIGENLPSLISRVVEIPGKFFVRVGMMNPSFAKKLLPDLINAYRSDKVFKFLHIPVQSGDDKVLDDMGRTYTVSEFKQIVQEFRKNFPLITIATDIICGYPTESDENFENTVKLIAEVKPDMINISRFFPRPNTRASTLKQLPSWKVKERSRRLTQLANEIVLEKNKKWIGWEGEILIDEIGKKGLIGRNNHYKLVVVESEDRRLVGKWALVRVYDASITHLKAELVEVLD